MLLRFVLTCCACPEQYYVLDENDRRVACVRLRLGMLTVNPTFYNEKTKEYITDHDTIIYKHSFPGSLKGAFETATERETFLDIVSAAIQRWWKLKMTLEWIQANKQ